MNSASQKKWDVFISYASEDKESIARPLAHLLDQAGLRVWFDEFSLRIGDSLFAAISAGLRESSYGVVIISEYFIRKRWPQSELAALFTIEHSGSDLILPIWHGVEAATVRDFSPLLADRVAAFTRNGLHDVVNHIASRLGHLRPAWGIGRFSGVWSGESGRLWVRHADDNVSGDYDWYGVPWAGTITGTPDGNMLPFEWHWSVDDRWGHGVFFQCNARLNRTLVLSLVGAWWYEGTVVDAKRLRLWAAHAECGNLEEVGRHAEGVLPWRFGLNEWETRRLTARTDV
jgi:hypothetical protein